MFLNILGHNHLSNIVYNLFDDIEKVQNSISESIGVKVELHNKVDPSLIGGIKVIIKDHVYDGSLKNKLSKLKNELLGG